MDRLSVLLLGFMATVAAGGWACVGFCARLIMRGQLVPRSTLQDALDASKFKDQEIVTKLNSILTSEVENGSTMHNFIESLQRVLRARPLDDGDGR